MEKQINRIRMLIAYLSYTEIRAKMDMPDDEFYLAYMAAKRMTHEI